MAWSIYSTARIERQGQKAILQSHSEREGNFKSRDKIHHSAAMLCCSYSANIQTLNAVELLALNKGTFSIQWKQIYSLINYLNNCVTFIARLAMLLFSYRWDKMIFSLSGVLIAFGGAGMETWLLKLSGIITQKKQKEARGCLRSRYVLI